MAERTSFNSIPMEIVEEVMKYLGKPALLQVRATCRYLEMICTPRVVKLVADSVRSSGWVTAYVQNLADKHLHGLMALYLAHGPPLDELDVRGQTALHVAARSGCAICAGLLLDAGADPNVVDRFRWTPLMLAARYGHVEVVEWLVCAGAQLDHNGFRGWTALHLANRYSHDGAVALLLAAGADPDVVDYEGIPAHDAFAQQGGISGPLTPRTTTTTVTTSETLIKVLSHELANLQLQTA